MPFNLYKSLRVIWRLLFVCTFCLIFSANYGLAESSLAAVEEATAEDLDTAERIRVLEAQRIRQDERSSLWGGTGLVFTRTAILLPRKHANLSGYFNYSHHDKIQGWGEGITFDDARENDMEFHLVGNYGITHYLEAGAFIHMFLQNEQNDPDQLHMRKAGIGWSGIDSKFRIMDIDKDGLGITSTFFVRLPSPQRDSNLTSDEFGYGAEINVSLKLVVISDWLEKLRFHTSFGWAYMDWFDTGLAGLYVWSKEMKNFRTLAQHGGKYRNDYYLKDLYDSKWKIDDVTMDDTYFADDFYTGAVAFEYRPISGLSTGLELVGYRMIRFNDDNLMLAPFATYTFRRIPLIKKVSKDMVTASLAGNFGMRSNNRSAPQWGILLGLTWHTDMLFL